MSRSCKLAFFFPRISPLGLASILLSFFTSSFLFFWQLIIGQAREMSHNENLRWAYLLFTQLRYMVRKKNSSSIFNLLHPWFLLSQLPRSKSNFSLPSMLNGVEEKEHRSSQYHSQTQCHLIFFFCHLCACFKERI